MSRLAVLCVLLVVAFLAQGQDTYDSKYDNIDVEAVLKNDRLLNRYVECILSENDSKCSEDGKALRRYLGEGLVTDCAKCTPKQKDNALIAVKFMVNNKPDMWKQIENMYDPTGSFLQKHPELKM
ncbi:ejaculatory bulb-specific protein 3 [Anabrus simplex]|uniref:ejaculatory bulb-specific protein 3 n=1 Tax=Anabrus simplex TaxID=316456 RepID=UPI0034DDBBBD